MQMRLMPHSSLGCENCLNLLNTKVLIYSFDKCLLSVIKHCKSGRLTLKVVSAKHCCKF